MHGVVARLETDREQPHRAEHQTHEHDKTDRGGDGHPPQRRGHQPGEVGGRGQLRERDGDAGEHGEHRHQRQPDGRRGVGEHPDATVRRALRRPRAAGRTRRAGGRTRPGLVGRHRPEHGRPGRDLRPVTDVGPGQQGAARPDAGLLTDRHRADVHVAAVEPVPREVDLGLDGAPGAEREQAGDGRDAVEVDVTTHPASEQFRVDANEGGGRQVRGPELVDQSLGEPEPQVHPATAGVPARADPAQHQARRGGTEQHPPEGVDEQQPPGEHPAPRDARQPRRVDDPVRDEQPEPDPRQPAQRPDRPHDDGAEHLRHLGVARDRRDRGVGAAGRRGHGVEGLREVGEDGVLVDVGDGDVRMPFAQFGDQLGCAEAPPTEVEEVLVGGGGRRAEDGGPVPGDPGGRAVELEVGGAGCRGTGSAGRAGWRPRQGVAVDLPGGAGGQGVDDGDTRDEGGRHRRPQLLGRGLGVEARVGGDVADEQPVARLGALDRSGGSADPGEAEQGAVDLTELDPSTTDLDLVVGTPLEDQTHAVEADDVAAAVGALPTQARHRGVHRGILLGVEVAGQTHAPDDQLARLSIGNALALRVDDGEVPAVEREADAHGGLAVELGTAGDDGGLGGAVGVPDLAGVGGQARADLGRARLAAEDEQADVGEGVGRPEGDEGGHGRDDGDVVGDQPGAEVHARAHEGARCRHEAGAVPPGEPHLLAAGVERDGQAGHDPVTRADRALLEEHPRLGVDEGGGVAVADGDALGQAGRARGEDDPGVVGELGVLLRSLVGVCVGRRGRAGSDDEVGADDRGDAGLAEDDSRPLVWVVVVDRHVRRAGKQDAGDRDVEVGGPRRDAHPDPVATPDTVAAQRRRELLGGVEQFVVGQDLAAVVDGRGVGVCIGGGAQDVDEGTRLRSEVGTQQRVGHVEVTLRGFA